MAQKKEGAAPEQGQGAQAVEQPAKNKMDAVRRALAKLGRTAKPAQIREHVKNRFGMDLSADLISTYKGEIKRKRKGKKKKGAKKQAAAPAAPPAKQPPRPPAKSAAAAISLEDMRLVKGLVTRVGPDALKGVIELLSR
ncbi:MAG: hypothetical protein HYS12_03215 [Planctomycetes bacterium]|nr:hypothetical protein [Planctomycetota bacterium]